MTADDFINDMKEILLTSSDINLDTDLQTLREWDSLSKMEAMAFLGRAFGVKVTISDLKGFKTPRDIARFAGLAV